MSQKKEEYDMAATTTWALEIEKCDAFLLTK